MKVIFTILVLATGTHALNCAAGTFMADGDCYPCIDNSNANDPNSPVYCLAACSLFKTFEQVTVIDLDYAIIVPRARTIESCSYAACSDNYVGFAFDSATTECYILTALGASTGIGGTMTAGLKNQYVHLPDVDSVIA